MRRTGLYRGTAGAIACGLALWAVPAAAVAPQEWVEQGTFIECGAGDEDLSVGLGGYFAPDGTLLDGGGGIAIGDELGYWAESAEGSFGDGSWTLSLNLVSGDDGTPAGSLQAAGEAVPQGDPITFDERFRDGNAWITQEGTVQPLLVSGAVVAGTGVAADLVGMELDCGGQTVDLTYGGTNPATRIFRWSSSSAYCPIGEDGVFWMYDEGGQAFGSVALGIDWDTGEPELVAEGMLEVDADSVSGALDVVQPPDTGWQVLVDLAIGDAIDKGHWREKWPTGAYAERYTVFPLTGTIALPDGTVAELSDCVLTSTKSKSRESFRAGQKPGGKAPANDLPDGALPLGVGESVTVSTRGAAEEPEAPCIAEWGGEVPLGRTVWYRVEGTGGDIGLSTVGSDFDTVLGVYDEQLQQIACVDDTEDGLQAALDLPTEPGTGYLVQVGGFAGSWGTAVVSAG